MPAPRSAETARSTPRSTTAAGRDLVAVRDGGESGQIAWRFATGAQVEVSASVTPDGIISIGSDDGYQYGVGPDGGELWRVATGDFTYSSSVATRSGLVVFGDNNGVVFVVDGRTGQESVQRQLERRIGSPDGIWSAPVVDAEGNIYLGTVSGHF